MFCFGFVLFSQCFLRALLVPSALPKQPCSYAFPGMSSTKMKLTRSCELRSAGTCQSGEQVNWGHLSQREPSGPSPTSCCTSAIGPMRSSPEPLRPHYTPLPPWLPAGVPDSVKIQQLQGTHEFTRSNYSQVLSKEMDGG